MTGSNDTGTGMFAAGRAVTRILARLGRTAGADEANHWAAFLAAAIVVVPPFVLSAIDGTAVGSTVDVPFLYDVDAIVRLLVVVPMLVVVSGVVGVQLNAAITYLNETDLVGADDQADYEGAVATVRRRVSGSGSALIIAAIAILISALVFLLTNRLEYEAGLSNWMVRADGTGGLTPAGMWFAFVSWPVVAFLLLGWAWRYVAWSLFLRDLGKLDLAILPGHPDLTGGLAPVARAHSTFVLVGFTVSALFSGAIANDLIHAGGTMASAGPEVAALMVVSLIVLLVPLTAFVPGMLKSKTQGILEYGHIAHDATAEFETRWKDGGKGLIDTGDPSALCDLGGDYDVVQKMRVFPLGLRQIMVLGVVLFVPFSALALTQVSLAQLLKTLAGRLL